MKSPLGQTRWQLALVALTLSAILGSGCGLFNNAPVISSLEAEKAYLRAAESCEIRVVASDPDGDELSYQWSASGGDISGQGATVTWTAPDMLGSCVISVRVTDGRGGEAVMELSVNVIPNSPPVVESLAAAQARVGRDESVAIKCVASDPDGDELSYQWLASGGGISGQGATVTWTAPGMLGICVISVKVTDGRGGEAVMELSVNVIPNSPPVVESLAAAQARVGRDESVAIKCVASDPDGDELSYQWSASGGDISGQGAIVTWTAPGRSGGYVISVRVTDGWGGEASEELDIGCGG